VHLIQYFVIQFVRDLQQVLSSWLVQFPLLRNPDHLDIQVHITSVWLTVAYKTNKHLIRKDMGVSEHKRLFNITLLLLERNSAF
jgi:hypothetical protein